MWAAARVQPPHESARCFSVVNLPVTWLPESPTGSASEWGIRMCAGGHERQAALPGVRARGCASEGALETSHAFSSKQKSRVICIYLHQLAETGQKIGTKPSRKEEKDVFSCSCVTGKLLRTRFQGITLTDGQADTSTLKD